jgi:hypothetical protein
LRCARHELVTQDRCNEFALLRFFSNGSVMFASDDFNAVARTSSNIADHLIHPALAPTRVRRLAPPFLVR